jgi:hypothetical protein
MTEEISEAFFIPRLKQEDSHKLKEWKKEEYAKVRSDLRLILEGQKNKSKRSTIRIHWISNPK